MLLGAPGRGGFRGIYRDLHICMYIYIYIIYISDHIRSYHIVELGICGGISGLRGGFQGLAGLGFRGSKGWTPETETRLRGAARGYDSSVGGSPRVARGSAGAVLQPFRRPGLGGPLISFCAASGRRPAIASKSGAAGPSRRLLLLWLLLL